MTSEPLSAVQEPTQPLIERLMAPFQRFAHAASASGVVLLAATAVALVWANSPWAHAYHALWETPLTLHIGGWTTSGTFHQLINDGLMAVFFFLVGLEIKRETLSGELASIRSAALPMFGALGGMLAPAVLYYLVARGSPAGRGWGIPMATDIAFALGVLALLGDRVPTGLKVFLAALAIVDDIGAILVIAVFYSGGVAWGPLAGAAAILLLAAAANRIGVRNPWAYAAIGLALWAAVLASGVHATVAGVLLAMTIPVRTQLHEAAFLRGAQRALEDFDAAAVVTALDPEVTVLSNTAHHTAVEELETLCELAQPPLIRLEHALHGIVAFGIMPLFALSNAGVTLSSALFDTGIGSPVTIGVVLGLVVGKPLGIAAFSWLAVRLGIAALPSGVTWPMVGAAGVLGGIGFTMALFIAGLAFTDATLLDEAKLAILVASTLTGVTGWLLLRRVSLVPSAASGAAEIPADSTTESSSGA
jgi:NhaA family Na+:H+ antiporter